MESPPQHVDEFEAIARLFTPLTDGAPEALGLQDDAAVIAARPGFDLVISKDAMVEGVHFLADDPLDLVARKLLRANLSDLAAKGADPWAYFLAAMWPARCVWAERERFVRGLRQDQDAFGLKLLGGDTSSTPGPLTLSVTILGWTPRGRMVRRSGAGPGDRVLVSGSIGDGWLGLAAARGELEGLGPQDVAWLADRYRLPQPRTGLIQLLREHATAAADVSDGLLADAGHIAQSSGVGMALALDRLPLSRGATAWLTAQADPAAAIASLASGGDDYEVVCCARPEAARALIEAAGPAGAPMTDVGEVVAAGGVQATWRGRALDTPRTGWRHG